MGYCVKMKIDLDQIPAEKVPEVLEAINKLHEPEVMAEHASGGSYVRGARTKVWYAWVDSPPVGGFSNLVSAFAAWRYHAEELEDGSVELQWFEGEKYGDDEFLFSQLAPFLEGTISCHGEDGTFWRFVFEDGELNELSGRVVYE